MEDVNGMKLKYVLHQQVLLKDKLILNDILVMDFVVLKVLIGMKMKKNVFICKILIVYNQKMVLIVMSVLLDTLHNKHIYSNISEHLLIIVKMTALRIYNNFLVISVFQINQKIQKVCKIIMNLEKFLKIVNYYQKIMMNVINVKMDINKYKVDVVKEIKQQLIINVKIYQKYQIIVQILIFSIEKLKIVKMDII